MSSFTAKVSVHTDIKDVSCPIFSLLIFLFLGQSHILLIPALMHERFTRVPFSGFSRGNLPGEYMCKKKKKKEEDRGDEEEINNTMILYKYVTKGILFSLFS